MSDAAQTTAEPAADDAEVLFPERTAIIGGEQITMHEYTFEEAMRLGGPISALTRALKAASAGSAMFDLDALRSAFGACWSDAVVLMSAACRRPADWVVSLSPVDGYQLQMLWWAVNGPFFAARLAESMAWDQVMAEQLASAGRTSLPN